MMRERTDIVDMLVSDGMTTVAAPMVRYSKLPFRDLVRHYGADIVYTPMILADPFRLSQHARASEFTSNDQDHPVVAQFAASNATSFSQAAELIYPYVDGVDLNCGCPQRWAIGDGVGGALLLRASSNPELLKDMILQTRRRVPNIPISLKIRLLEKHADTVELARRIEHAGASYITLHGRTLQEKTSTPVHVQSIRLVKDSIRIPLVANGDIFTAEDANMMHSSAGVNGVMSARGLLSNPALFSGAKKTPLDCIVKFISLHLKYGMKWHLFHKHLIFMLHDTLTPVQRSHFNCLFGFPQVIAFLDDNLFDGSLCQQLEKS